MILWGVIFGAMFGGLSTGLFGLIAGAFFGALAGQWLRSLVRREISAAIAGAASPTFETPQAAPDTITELFVPSTPLPQPAEAQELESAREMEANAWPDETLKGPPVAETTASLLTGFPAKEWLSSAKEWLLGGNTIVRTGLVILFVGLTFLARYAASIGLFPIELRLTLVGAIGAMLVAIGFIKREERPVFARALEGTGVAVLYLTVFASARLYELIPVVPAFGLMILFSALGCALAIMQNSQPMALAAFVGGFAVPVLLGGDSQQPFVPFSYYTILNLAILGIAWRRSWRILNLVGFFATFGMAWVWGLQNYQPALYGICQSFLVTSVLIYLATAVLYAHNTPGKFGNIVDGILLFGPALAGFGLQVGLVRPYEFGSAYSSLAFGAVYIGLAAAIVWRDKKGMRQLTEYLIGIGVGFVTLAIPLALSVHWTAAGWAVEGAVAFWLGIRQQRWIARLFGLVLQLFGGAIFLVSFQGIVSPRPLANAGFVTALLIGAAFAATAWWLRNPLRVGRSSFAESYGFLETHAEKLFFLAGFTFVCIALVSEIGRARPPSLLGAIPEPVFSTSLQRLLSLVAILSAMWCSAKLGQRTNWRVAEWPGRVSAIPVWLVFLVEAGDAHHILYAPNWLLWLIALVLTVDLLFVSDRRREGSAHQVSNAMHVATVWLVAAMIADCLSLGVDRARLWGTSWSGVIFLVTGVGAVGALNWWAGTAAATDSPRARRWPLDGRVETYFWIAAAPVAALVYIGALLSAIGASGVTEPLPYLPILNPVDLSVGLALLVLLLWRRTTFRASTRPTTQFLLQQRRAFIAGGALVFAAVNGMWLRTAHHWLGVAWNPITLSESFVVQAGLAILWTLLAMTLMLYAYKRQLRALWIAGATLLVAVVLKLVLVDLSNAGGWERVVSYVAVGALMLVIGYFAPLPPRGRSEADVQAAA